MLALGALEWTFMTVLAAATGIAGVFGIFVVARLIEPRGLKVLLRKLAGKPV